MDERVEEIAAELHEQYRETARRLGWPMKVAIDCTYDKLTENAKELDRVFARWHLAHIATLDTALAASRAKTKVAERRIETTIKVCEENLDELATKLDRTEEKLRDAERARDDARELVALEFERGKLCGIAEEREHAEQFKARWFHQTTQEAIARAEHAEQRVAALESARKYAHAVGCMCSPAYGDDARCLEMRSTALTPPPVAPSMEFEPDGCAKGRHTHRGDCWKPVAPSGGER